ncbi:MAG: DNA/RNA non-specific endonuclease [Candidatus Cryptobacteroides sp.]
MTPVSCGTESSFNTTLSGLESGTDYYYRAYATVQGTDGSVETFYSTTNSFRTSSAPAVDESWLELASAKKGSRYVTNTYYGSSVRNYTHFYDTEMMTSLWTAYPLSSSYMGSLSRPSSWYYSPSIDEQYQADLRSLSYSDDTYSRGHMCPNASRNGDSDMQKQTFYVTNQVPQIQNSFNSGIWSMLEEAVQAIVKGTSEEIYVVTGVAFNKEGESKTINYVTPKSNSSQNCPIPNYFYKLVLRVKYTGSTVTSASAIGFWFEHKAYTSDSYTNYVVSVDEVEAWTGFDFFVNLPDKIEVEVEAERPTWSDFQSF